MIKRIAFAAVAASMLFGGLAAPAQAQTAARVYDNGSVWQISHIQTKPGMFDEYMAYLNGPWRASQEAGKKDGDILSYKILAVSAPRDGEADLLLMIEYKNMAVFDRSQADADKQTAAIFGSTQKASQGQIAREAMRTPRGGLLARELKFIK